MKTFQIILATIISVTILGLVGFFLVGYFKPKPAGIFVDTAPASSVYINGSLVGKSPFKGTYEAGNVNVKLVPEVLDQNLIPFETKLTLTPGIQTVVRREFGKSEEESSGDIISFEKGPSQSTSLVVISTPDNAQISLDGVPRGFAPYKTSVISPAEHQITIKAPGYSERVITAKTIVGFRLTVFAKLAKSDEKLEEENKETTSVPVVKSYVEILQTPTGFLRVRTEPGSSGEEIAEVKPGSKYPYLDTDAATGWFKIQYGEPKAGLPGGIVGWVSNEFTKKVDEDSTATSSASMSN